MSKQVFCQEDDSDSRKTLSGIKSLDISVSDIGQDAIIQRGLTSSQIQTDVELKLRSSGIKIIPSPKQNPTNVGDPHIFVQITIIKTDNDLVAFDVNFELRQIVSLTRDHSILAYATTWRAGVTGLIPLTRSERIRDVAKDLTDQFINAYLAANK